MQSSNLWRVGFYPNSFTLIPLMSGLVDIHDVRWHQDDNALSMIVEDRDRTATLFRNGKLVANKIADFEVANQSIMVDAHYGRRDFPDGGN